MNLDQAIAETVQALKEGRAAEFNYDVHPSSLCDRVAVQSCGQDRQEIDKMQKQWYPLFEEAAWELTRRGILRPGVRDRQGQAVDDGGYSLTVAGQKKLPEIDDATLLLYQPGSLSTTLEVFENKYGDGFGQRAQEAIRCRNAEAWLACCSMTGAAAESVLLAIAIAKDGDEAKVLKRYFGTRGRQSILDLVVGQARLHIRDQLTTFTGIISLWRDEAAHGRASALGVANADEGLRQLLHMCQWVDREWDTLMG